MRTLGRLSRAMLGEAMLRRLSQAFNARLDHFLQTLHCSLGPIDFGATERKEAETTLPRLIPRLHVDGTADSVFGAKNRLLTSIIF